MHTGIKLGDQDKTWALHKVCRSCIESLRRWSNGKRKSLAFVIPMVWREPTARGNECYFFSCNVSGFNAKNKHHIPYPNLPSAIRPVPHLPDVPVPASPAALKDLEESSAEMSSSHCKSPDDSEYQCSGDQSPTLFGQEELNDLVRDLNFPQLSALLPGSRLKSKTC